MSKMRKKKTSDELKKGKLRGGRTTKKTQQTTSEMTTRGRKLVLLNQLNDNELSSSGSGLEADTDDDLENTIFKEMSAVLNHSRKVVLAPPQLTPAKCQGIGDPLEMWNNMVRRDELIRPSATILEKHPVLSEHTRVILLDWIKEVCETECLHRETYHLAIDYIDRFLLNVDRSKFIVNMENFQLIGTTALFMASKYEEIYPPKCHELAGYTDDACSAQNIIEMELKMLEVLHWSLTPVTSLHWLKIFLQLMGDRQVQFASALVGDKHLADKLAVVPDFMREDYIHMAKILDYLLLEVNSLSFSYRQLAAGVIYNCYEPQNLVQQVTGIDDADLFAVVDWVKPVVDFCDRRRPLGDPLPVFQGIRSSDVHEIQTHDKYPVDVVMREISEERKRHACLRQEMLGFTTLRRTSAMRTLTFFNSNSLNTHSSLAFPNHNHHSQFPDFSGSSNTSF